MRYLFALLVLIGLRGFGQQPVGRQRLITIEFKKYDNSPASDFIYFVAYNFKAGRFSGKDTIFGGHIANVFTDEAPRLLKNRYVVSVDGTVLDIKTKALVKNPDLPPYPLVQNEISPNGMASLRVDHSRSPFRIILRKKGQPQEVVVADAGKGNPLTGGSFSEVSWLDNESFLYFVHVPLKNSPQTAYDKVMFRKFNIRTHSDFLLLSLDSTREGTGFDNLLKEPGGQIVYASTNAEFSAIDLARARLIPHPYQQLGYDFSMRGSTHGATYRYKDQDIGEFWCLGQYLVPGMLALAYGRYESNLAYPRGTKIWSAQTGEWLTFDVPWLNRILGWVEE